MPGTIDVLLENSLRWNHLSEKNEMGCQAPLMCCWRTAPTAVSEASVIKQVGALD